MNFENPADLADYDHVIPLCRESYGRLEAMKAKDPRWIMPSREVFELFEDKSRLAEALIDSPWAALQPRVEGGGHGHPLILKPRIGANSEGCLVLRNEQEIAGQAGKIGSGDWVVQRFVPEIENMRPIC